MAADPVAPPLTRAEIDSLSAEIRELATARDAVILAHNYQVPEVQDIAHFVGDSLGLSQQAAAAPEQTIVFCGVHFMAETAAILCPQKTVLIPDPDAGCSLADSIDADQLRDWKADHPRAVVVMYVNTSADVKRAGRADFQDARRLEDRAADFLHARRAVQAAQRRRRRQPRRLLFRSGAGRLCARQL